MIIDKIAIKRYSFAVILQPGGAFMHMLSTVLDAIGNTPLIKINTIHGTDVYAKLEYCNPGGSIKDRSALYLVQKAEQVGFLKPGYTIIDASSGNHGAALAMIGAAKGYRVIITASQNVSFEKINAMRAYGAQVIVCPATEFIQDPESYHSRAMALAKEIPHSCMLNQYFSTLNTQAHYHSTGPEIWRQTSGKITHFFAAAGTGGTVSGVGQFLKEQNSAIKIIAVDSVNSYRSTGGKPKPYIAGGMGVDFDSPVINYDVIDDIITVTDEEVVGTTCHLAHKKGVLIGPSSGAVACAVEKYKDRFCAGDLAVALFGDSGRAYLTKQYYQQPDEELLFNNEQSNSSELQL